MAIFFELQPDQHVQKWFSKILRFQTALVNRQNQIVVKDVGQFLVWLIKKISTSFLATYHTEEQTVINANKKVKISMTSLHTY